MADYVITSFGCDCKKGNHRLIVYYGTKYWGPYVNMTTRINHLLPWYKRVFVAIGYIFGLTCDNVEQFEIFSLNKEDVDKLRNMCQDFINSVK